jgi:hypothetical protein
MRHRNASPEAFDALKKAVREWITTPDGWDAFMEAEAIMSRVNNNDAAQASCVRSSRISAVSCGGNSPCAIAFLALTKSAQEGKWRLLESPSARCPRTILFKKASPTPGWLFDFRHNSGRHASGKCRRWNSALGPRSGHEAKANHGSHLRSGAAANPRCLDYGCCNNGVCG